MHRACLLPGMILGAVASTACSDATQADPEVAISTATARLPPVADPIDRVTEMEIVEDLSEAVANRLIEWGHHLQERDFHTAQTFLADDFLGESVSDPGTQRESAQAAEVSEVVWQIERPEVHARDPFVQDLRDFLSPFADLELVFPKLKGAEFARGADTWGALTIQLRVLGRGPSGERLWYQVGCRGEVVQREGRLLLRRLRVESREDQKSPWPLFQDVSEVAGIAHRGARFGKDGNDSFFWNGAAVCDFDDDGRFDIFVCSNERNYLYHNRGDGSFEEVAERVGVAAPGGGTGALSFDADNDGDSDLVVGHVGFERRGEMVGRCNQFYRNNGEGKFENATAAAGFGEHHVTFSLVAADVNADGWLDFFVCSYNTEGFTAPDSWHQASNGTPNALYLNQGDGSFVNVAEAAGLHDRRWTYAAAFADFDGDGDQDLYVANDYSRNNLYRNRGDGTFEDVADDFGVTDVGNGMGVTFGDYDGDGDLDLYVANMSSSAGTRILKRLTDPSKDELSSTLFKLAAGNSIFDWDDGAFRRVPGEQGGTGASWAWSSQFADLDLDGDSDLVCVNGFISGDSGGSFKDT